MPRPIAASIDEYIAEFPPETQRALRQVRDVIATTAPDAVETISYAIPTFDLDGRHLVHFAGYDHHVGFYPTPNGMDEFEPELSRFQRGKGSVRFPLNEPMPLDLIRRIVEFRAARTAARKK
jgi:uncharacterized protein YdhG (YjbR/CyaY superfamily)